MLNNLLILNIIYILTILEFNIKHYFYTYLMSFYVIINIINTKKTPKNI